MRRKVGSFRSVLIPAGGLLPGAVVAWTFPDRVPSSADLLIEGLTGAQAGTLGVGTNVAWGLLEGPDTELHYSIAYNLDSLGPKNPYVRRNWIIPAGRRLQLGVANFGILTTQLEFMLWGSLLERGDYCGRLLAA
jgi:hypothetical protein